MRPKYEFTGKTMNYDGHTLHQIKRIKDGHIGGWIEKEENLSQKGRCWVSGNAKVYEDAQVSCNAKVHENAQVYGRAQVKGKSEVFGYATLCGNAQVYGNAQICNHAKVGGSAEVYDDAQVWHTAKVHEHAQVYGSAIVYDNAEVSGSAEVYGNAKVFIKACIYGKAQIFDNAIIRDQAIVTGNAQVFGDAYVCGNAKIDKGCISTGKYDNTANEESDVIKDFIYKIDESSKLDVQTSYDSIDAFFDDDSDNSYTEHEYLTIIAVDTKVPLVKLEKTQVKDKNMFKFVVDITNEDGDNYSVKSVIDTKDKFEQLLRSTVDALNSYSQFSKYADDLNNCL